ncbi:MAG: DUF1847 domain-containing protein [Peptococcaceae bacterium]
MYTCDSCTMYTCRAEKKEQFPKNCPIPETDALQLLEEYQKPENFVLAYHSALIEADGYCKKTRVEEIIAFAQRCGFANIGLAFCFGLRKEARIFAKILRSHGFTVNSLICKNGSIPKEALSLSDEQKVRPGTFEAMCNPIGQAQFLNKMQTHLNIILGLCVGHDSLFIKYSQAPVTILAVKDRVLAHNPLGAIYCAESYYANKLNPSDK